MAASQERLEENERFRQMLDINIYERLRQINESISSRDRDSIDRFIADTKRRNGRHFEYGQEKRDFYVHFNILQFLNQGSGLSSEGISVTAKRHRNTFYGLEYSRGTRTVFRALFYGTEEIRYLINDIENRGVNLPAVQQWVGDNVILEEYHTNGRLDRPEQLGPALIELRRSLVFKEFKFAVNGAEHRIGGPSHVVMNNASTVVMRESYMINGRYRTDVPFPHLSLWPDHTVMESVESVTLNTGSEIPTMGLVTKEYYGDGHIRNEDFRKEALSGELVLHRVGGAAVTIYNNDGTVNEERYFLNGVSSNEVMPVSVCYRIDGSIENFVMPDTVGGEIPLNTSGFDAGSSYDELPLTDDITEILESYARDEDIVRQMRPIALEAASPDAAADVAANIENAAAASAFADSVQIAQTGSDIEDVSQAVNSLSMGSDSISSAFACSAQSNFSNSVLIWSLPREILDMVKSRLSASDLESIAATSKNSRMFEREEKMRSALSTMSRYRVRMEDLEQSLRDMNLRVTDGNKMCWLDKLLFINRYESVSAREIQIERIDGLYRLLKHGRLFESGTNEGITYEMYNIAHGDGYEAHNEHGPALIERYKNGVLRHEAYYINGRLHRNPLDGAAETYYRGTGRIWSTEYCLEGRTVFANGAASKQLWGNDGTIAEIIHLYPNNRIKYSCKRYMFETHPQDFYTETKQYYENGKLCRVKRRKNGVLHCRYMPAVIEWFSNGKLKRTDYYIAGQPRRFNRQVETHQEHDFYDSDA